MSHIHIERPHQLNKARLRRQVEELADKLEQEFEYNSEWHGDRLIFKRTGAQGHIDLEDDRVVVDIKLGVLFRPIAKKVESTVQDYLDKHLS